MVTYSFAPLQLKDSVGLKSVGSRLGHLIKVLSTSELRSLTFDDLGLACNSTDTLDVQVTDVQVRQRRGRSTKVTLNTLSLLSFLSVKSAVMLVSMLIFNCGIVFPLPSLFPIYCRLRSPCPPYVLHPLPFPLLLLPYTLDASSLFLNSSIISMCPTNFKPALRQLPPENLFYTNSLSQLLHSSFVSSFFSSNYFVNVDFLFCFFCSRLGIYTI